MRFSRWITRLILILTIVIAVGVIVFVICSAPDSEGGWATIAGGLAVIAAVVAAWTGQRALELQEDALRPYPYPTVDSTSRYGLLQLRVENTGGSAAHDIRLKWDKPLLNSKGEPVVFTVMEGAPDIPVLLPGESASILIDGVGQFFGAVSDANYSGSVEFKDASGSDQKHRFLLSVEGHRKSLYHEDEEPMTHHQLQQLPSKMDGLIRELKMIRERLSLDDGSVRRHNKGMKTDQEHADTAGGDTTIEEGSSRDEMS